MHKEKPVKKLNGEKGLGVKKHLFERIASQYKQKICGSKKVDNDINTELMSDSS